MKRQFDDRGREDELRALLHERVLVLDGAMGTMLQARDLTAKDFGGAQLEGCNENLVLTRPDVVQSIHEGYFAAGSDIVETNTFGAIKHVLAEYGLSDKAVEINREAARLAVAAAKRFANPAKPRFVAGALGPGTKTISVTGGITFDEVVSAYEEASRGLLEGGADLLLLETQQDTLNLKASLIGFERAFEKLGRSVPVMLSVSIETMGTMLGGQTAEALVDSVAHFPLIGLGLNCATGPDFMTDHLRTIAGLTRTFTVCYPNAGLPDENGQYNETPEMVAKKLERFCNEGWVNVVGGCCGTTAEHIRLISQMASSRRPRKPVKFRRSSVSGLESYTITDAERPVIVGERANVIGSRLFKELIVKGAFEEASEVGRRQVRGGAHILDVCLANPDREEKADIVKFLDFLTKKVKAPLMIDSTDAFVIEEALKRTPGKSIVNSINLEDGEERFEAVVPLIHRYGAAVVVGTIDEDKAQGMGVTRARKLEIAARCHELLTKKYGLAAEDLIFDPLVFPAGTGDKNYWGSAVETIEGIRLIKQAFPRCKTVLGVSNVSFGLPAAGREVLNAVFLHHCVQAGLDLAIVNAEKIARYASIPEVEKKLCWDLLSWKGPGDPSHPKGFDAVAAFSAHYREAKPTAKTGSERLKAPIDERLPKNVVEGSKEGLLDDLAELLKSRTPLEIINGPLMNGMDEVGRLFGANEMIVAEVLQSAEVMKAAVAFLEPHMDKTKSVARGKVLLATVKGDVHDIGKNLVHIILKNNGYEITDLGIKVAPETLIEAVKSVAPHIIGLSGLLVKSAQQMTITAEDLTNAGITIPILVGGAALSPKFAASRIAPLYDGPVLYAKDAMTGLELSNQLQDAGRREGLLEKNREIQEHLRTPVQTPVSVPSSNHDAPLVPAVRTNHDIPKPPDLKAHVISDFPVEEVFRYINPIMLYGKHLGLKGSPERMLKEGHPKAVELYRQVAEIQNEILARGLMKAKAVYRFYAAQSYGDKILLFNSPKDTEPVEIFEFPRQPGGDRLCLADFVLPKNLGKPDFAALFVVTCGAGIRELSDRYRDAGEYLKSHALQAIAIESAEGFAELLHERLRAMWGIADTPGITLKEKFQARYRGLRVSFGYPACPALEDQTKLFKLLEPTKSIGVELTEGFMMEPEASVSALVFHHPEARYFSVGPAPALTPE
ncbi:MAG: methionine synthase [Elusimicrobia bacterium]|nr:methionine synthase [Elusimicrobiota bacterium]